MSLDRSLRVKAGLSRHRNVLNRAERIKALAELERWEDSRSVFGLPKVGHRKPKIAGKKKEKKAEGAEGEAAPAAGAAAAAPAAGGAKAPAGGKAAAPPAKGADKGGKK